LDSGDQGGDAFGRLGGLLREPLHLCRHDSKPAASIARPRRFDRRVVGKEIGLASDVGDTV
jgi:hypothetical protein